MIDKLQNKKYKKINLLFSPPLDQFSSLDLPPGSACLVLWKKRLFYLKIILENVVFELSIEN